MKAPSIPRLVIRPSQVLPQQSRPTGKFVKTRGARRIGNPPSLLEKLPWLLPQVTEAFNIPKIYYSNIYAKFRLPAGLRQPDDLLDHPPFLGFRQISLCQVTALPGVTAIENLFSLLLVLGRGQEILLTDLATMFPGHSLTQTMEFSSG
jgi:hypothetical protein